MSKKRQAVRLIYKTNPVTPEVLKEAVELGMIPKKDLKNGRYYKGSCRNARFAMWDAKKEIFCHLRTKFGEIFTETISHPEDDRGFDVFVPVELLSDFFDDEEFYP